MANLGVQAGSGFDASDLTTGTLGNTVQDNITRLGTVTSGTFNGTIGTSATINAGTNVSGIGQLIGVSRSNSYNAAGTIVTLESSKNYHVFMFAFRYVGSTSWGGYHEYYRVTVDSSGVVSGHTSPLVDLTSNITISSQANNQIKAHTNEGSSAEYGKGIALVFEEGSTMDYS